MKVLDHRLDGVRYVPAPFPATRKMHPSAIVMHYTAGRNFRADLASMTAPKSPGFAHVLIGEFGDVIQLVPFDQVAFHAGASRFVEPDGRVLQNFNKFSIGIELTNPGFLTRVNGGVDWLTWFGTPVPARNAVAARHSKMPHADYGWVPYGRTQMAVAVDVVRAINEEYGGLPILGHDEISAEKLDPGPLFPMDRFREAASGEVEWRYDP